MLIDKLPDGITVLTYPDRESWLEARKEYITASEAAACLDESPYHSKFSLYHTKLGLKEQPTVDEEVLQMGHIMEPVISRLFSERTGFLVEDPGEFALVVNPKYPWLAATLDNLMLADGETRPGPLELKNPSAFNLKDWEGDAPLKFHVQNQVQMMCCGVETGAIAAIVGGTHFRYRLTKANARFQEIILKETKEFADMITNGTPPDPDGHAATGRALSAMYPEDVEPPERIALPMEAAEWKDELDALKEQKKDIEQQIDTLNNKVKACIGDNAIGYFPGGEFSWKAQGGNPQGIFVKAPSQQAIDELLEVMANNGITGQAKFSPRSRVLRSKLFKK